MQPPSLLSSLSEITVLRQPEAVRQCPVPEPRPRQTVPLRPLPHGDDGDDTHEARRTSSSTRSLLRDPQPPSHRWPPALRGSPQPEPAPQMPLISGRPHPRVPLPDQPGSPH